MKYLWKVWANSLGVKARAEDDVFSDHVAIVRTIILLVYVMIAILLQNGGWQYEPGDMLALFLVHTVNFLNVYVQG